MIVFGIQARDVSEADFAFIQSFSKGDVAVWLLGVSCLGVKYFFGWSYICGEQLAKEGVGGVAGEIVTMLREGISDDFDGFVVGICIIILFEFPEG